MVEVAEGARRRLESTLDPRGEIRPLTPKLRLRGHWQPAIAKRRSLPGSL